MIALDAEWRESAACKDTDPDHWFPLAATNTADLHAICSGCPSRGACLAHAIAYGERGYWAGTSEAQRRRMGASAWPQSAFGRVKPGPKAGTEIAHGTNRGYAAHRRYDVPMCDECQKAHNVNASGYTKRHLAVVG